MSSLLEYHAGTYTPLTDDPRFAAVGRDARPYYDPLWTLCTACGGSGFVDAHWDDARIDRDADEEDEDYDDPDGCPACAGTGLIDAAPMEHHH